MTSNFLAFTPTTIPAQKQTQNIFNYATAIAFILTIPQQITYLVMDTEQNICNNLAPKHRALTILYYTKRYSMMHHFVLYFLHYMKYNIRPRKVREQIKPSPSGMYQPVVKPPGCGLITSHSIEIQVGLKLRFDLYTEFNITTK
jgi:hypothetical protein